MVLIKSSWSEQMTKNLVPPTVSSLVDTPLWLLPTPSTCLATPHNVMMMVGNMHLMPNDYCLLTGTIPGSRLSSAPDSPDLSSSVVPGWTERRRSSIRVADDGWIDVADLRLFLCVLRRMIIIARNRCSWATRGDHRAKIEMKKERKNESLRFNFVPMLKHFHFIQSPAPPFLDGRSPSCSW